MVAVNKSMLFNKENRSMVDRETYSIWQGMTWPSYEDFIDGKLLSDSVISELTPLITEFIEASRRPNRVILALETMVTYGCTLACKGCTNFSDYKGHSRGNIKWKDFRKDFKRLYERTIVDSILLMGGEPLLNKDFPNWIKGIRTEFPKVRIVILTNGHLLLGNTWLIDYMKEYGNIWLKISNHVPGADWYDQAVALVKKSFNWKELKKSQNIYKQVFASKVEFLHDPKYNCFLEIPEYDKYQVMATGDYGNLKPWKQDPVDSFKRCMAADSVAFNDGKLYKCTMNWNLQYALADHGQQDDSDWKGYLYKGVDIHTCTEQELDAFISNIGKPHKICGMCPAASQPDSEVMMDHFGTTTSKINFENYYDKKIRRNL